MTIDIAALASDPKGTEFDTKRSVYVPAKPSEVVSGALHKALTAFLDGKVTHRNFRRIGDQATLIIKYGNTAVPLRATGRTANLFSVDDWPKVVEQTITEIDQGEYDEVLAELQANFKAQLAKAREAAAKNAAEKDAA